MNKRLIATRYALLAVLTLSLTLTACKKFFNERKLFHFDQQNLVANNNEYDAAHIDTTLINAWGIAFNPGGVPWVNSQGGHVSEVYDKEGNALRAPVWIPGPDVKIPGNPTGIVFSGGDDFVLSNGKPARFIFVNLDGVISGWNPDAGDAALMIDASTSSVYTGLTLVTVEGQHYLLAADFRGGKIAVWDATFTGKSWDFTDPSLPAGYSPYNIQVVGDWVYVAYAKPGPNGPPVVEPGAGVVNIFKTTGEFVKRFTDGGALNAPWGIAEAKSDFFKDNEDDSMAEAAMSSGGKSFVLVGNFGDGKINAYTADGELVGALKSRGRDIVIPGLWAITFPPATATAIDPNRLYFAAGPDEEKDGLFGYIQKK